MKFRRRDQSRRFAIEIYASAARTETILGMLSFCFDLPNEISKSTLQISSIYPKVQYRPDATRRLQPNFAEFCWVRNAIGNDWIVVRLFDFAPLGFSCRRTTSSMTFVLSFQVLLWNHFRFLCEDSCSPACSTCMFPAYIKWSARWSSVCHLNVQNPNAWHLGNTCPALVLKGFLYVRMR